MSLFFNANDFVTDVGYPIEECGIIELENDINEDYMSVIESMYVMHMEKIKYDVITENAFKTFISKIKEFFKQLWERVKKFFAWVKSLFTKKVKDFQASSEDKELLAEMLPGILEEIEEAIEDLENGIDKFEAKELNKKNGIDIGSLPASSQTQYIAKILQTGTSSQIKKLPKNIQTEIISNVIKIRSFVKKESGEDVKASEEMRKKEIVERYILKNCPLAERVDFDEGTVCLKKEVYPIPLSKDVYEKMDRISGLELIMSNLRINVRQMIESGSLQYDIINDTIESFYKEFEEKFKTRDINTIDLEKMYANKFKNQPSSVYITNGIRIWKDPYIIDVNKEVSKLEKSNEEQRQATTRFVDRIDKLNSVDEKEKQAQIRISDFLKQTSLFVIKLNDFKIKYLNRYLDVHKQVIDDIAPILKYFKSLS